MTERIISRHGDMVEMEIELPARLVDDILNDPGQDISAIITQELQSLMEEQKKNGPPKT